MSTKALLLLLGMVVGCGLVGLAIGQFIVGIAVGVAMVLLVALPGLLLNRPSKHRWLGDAAPRLPSFFRWPWGPQ